MLWESCLFFFFFFFCQFSNNGLLYTEFCSWTGGWVMIRLMRTRMMTTKTPSIGKESNAKFSWDVLPIWSHLEFARQFGFLLNINWWVKLSSSFLPLFTCFQANWTYWIFIFNYELTIYTDLMGVNDMSMCRKHLFTWSAYFWRF